MADDRCPENPIAWLLTIAMRRGIDHFWRADNLHRKTADIEHARGGEKVAMPGLDRQVDGIKDDVLWLSFLACHPALTAKSRAAFTLRTGGGPTTAEIARGFLATESTLSQRISRANQILSAAHTELVLAMVGRRPRWGTGLGGRC